MSKFAQYEHLYGLVGYPLGHSFSQSFFNEKFKAKDINSLYVNFEMPSIDNVRSLPVTYPNLVGFNVTIPYKEQIIALLDELDPEASKIGAVNVVKVIRRPDGRISLKGYNSDHIGFSDSIKSVIDPVIHRKALILGTGGASKAVAHALKLLGLDFTFVSRSKKPNAITYEQVTSELLEEYKVIVNASPVGMYPHVDECPNIPYSELSYQHICYDLVYNPTSTLFMQKALESGAMVRNGFEMLVLQALAAWRIWNE